MAQLAQFNGGKSIRIAPHLIQPNEGITYLNIDNTSNTIKPVKTSFDELQNFGSNSGFYFFSGNWVAKPYATSFVEFQERLYFSTGTGIPQKTFNGTTFFNLGIATPTTTPTTVYNGTLDPADTKVRQYCYTYYNSADGAESAPSEYSAEVSYTTDNITISNILPSTDPQVTGIKLYRLGGPYTEMVLVATLAANSTSYVDTLADLSIDGAILTSSTSGQAPSGLDHLTEHNVMLFGSIGDKLYYTDVAFVNNWSPFYFIDFDATIIGLGSTQNGLLVFTKDKTYIVTGTSPTTLSKILLHGSQGCLNHKTIKYIDNNLIWQSRDGLCTSNGGSVTIITLDKLGLLSLSAISGEIWDNQYFLFHTTGILIADFRFGPLVFRDLSIIANGTWYSEQFDKLYYIDTAGKLWSLFNGNSYLSYTYKTGRLTEGALTVVKNYKTFYVYAYGVATVKIYIDGILSLTKVLEVGLNEIKPPQTDRLGYYVEFEVSGTGEVAEIEYKMEARQNGR